MQNPVRPQTGAWPRFWVYFPSLPSWCGQSSHLAPRFPSIIPAPCCPQSLFISCASAEKCSSLRSHVLCPLTSSRSLLQHHLLSEAFPSLPVPNRSVPSWPLRTRHPPPLELSHNPYHHHTEMQFAYFFCLMNDIFFACLMNDKNACVYFFN